MIIAILIFQILFRLLVSYNLDTTTTVIIYALMFISAAIAQARWSAMWAELDIIDMKLDKAIEKKKLNKNSSDDKRKLL